MKNNYVEDTKYLTKESDIEGYFTDQYDEHFDCGQGYAQVDATCYAKIGEQFYEVYMTADIGSQRQDRGDRLYWVEEIESVTYKKVSKSTVIAAWRWKLVTDVTSLQDHLIEATEKLTAFDKEHGAEYLPGDLNEPQYE